jgi:hypothetical protein
MNPLRAGCWAMLIVGSYHLLKPVFTTVPAGDHLVVLGEIQITMVVAAIGLAASHICERLDALRPPAPAPPPEPPPDPAAPPDPPHG